MRLPGIPDRFYVWVLRPAMTVFVIVGALTEAQRFAAEGWSPTLPLLLLCILGLALLVDGVLWLRRHVGAAAQR